MLYLRSLVQFSITVEHSEKRKKRAGLASAIHNFLAVGTGVPACCPLFEGPYLTLPQASRSSQLSEHSEPWNLLSCYLEAWSFKAAGLTRGWLWGGFWWSFNVQIRVSSWVWAFCSMGWSWDGKIWGVSFRPEASTPCSTMFRLKCIALSMCDRVYGSPFVSLSQALPKLKAGLELGQVRSPILVSVSSSVNKIITVPRRNRMMRMILKITIICWVHTMVQALFGALCIHNRVLQIFRARSSCAFFYRTENRLRRASLSARAPPPPPLPGTQVR